ncbi:hypothetical protein V8E52_009470 [Russula decolorans]
MRWFGQVRVDGTDERREMDVEKVARQVSLGILPRQYCTVQGWFRRVPWSLFPPSTIDSSFDPNFLSGTYCTCRVTQISEDEFMTKWVTRERWKAEDIKPYMSDIAVDTKDLDKLLLKDARALMDKDSSWYNGASPMSTHCGSLFSLYFDSTVPCNHYLSLRRLF